jgi:signal recognition particle receptor subunit beta
MWEILTEGGIGLILLVSNARPDPFADMHFFLNAFKSFIERTKVVIGITQMDLSPQPTLKDYHLQLKNNDLRIPLFEVDARKKDDISLLVETLLYPFD